MPRAQIKDEKQYQKLREQGESKEKSAGSPTPRPPAGGARSGAKGGKGGSYQDWSKTDLVKKAREIGIKGRSSMSKDQLIKALRNH